MKVLKDENGNSYGLIDGKLIPICEKKEASVKAKKSTETTGVKLIQITPKTLPDTLKDMSIQRIVEIFGKINEENGYPDSKSVRNFWKFYTYPTGVKRSISKRVLRNHVITKQMKSAKLSKKAKANHLNKCKESNYNRIKWWENDSNRGEIIIEKAVGSLAKENESISEQIKGL